MFFSSDLFRVIIDKSKDSKVSGNSMLLIVLNLFNMGAIEPL